MRRDRAIAVLILLLGLTASGIAWAHGNQGHQGFRGHHHHGHFHGRASAGVAIGVPLFSYPYYPHSATHVYAYPPVAAAPYPPPVYIERDDPGQSDGAAPQGTGYWHYCANPQGYYPYVKDCPAGWQLVPAYPPQ